MLVELAVRNFAVIEDLRLRLGPGYNVITGETGAGKSILIDAVTGLLGGRIGSDSIRAGQDAAHIEGIFEVDAGSEAVRAVLADVGVDAEEGLVILSRDIAAGRSVARINGRAVPASSLASLAPHLVDIHGQSDNLSLLKPATQLSLIDAYAGLADQREHFAERVAELRHLRREREALNRDEREVARMLDLLNFQIEEIEAARLEIGEDNALEAERQVLMNAERLIELSELAYSALYEAADDVPAASELLGRAANALAELARLDTAREVLAQQIGDLAVQAAELAREVRAYRDAVDVDPGRLSAVDERLELIRTLKRKYGATIEEVLAFGDRAAREAEELEGGQSRLGELEQTEEALVEELAGLAIALSERRGEAAAKLSAAVEAELAGLNMARAKFSIALGRHSSSDGLPIDQERFAFDASGIDRVEFLVAPNPGEPPRPLARIASGGETARLMLALKVALAEVDQVPVLIFDEVDAGIGGRSGHVIGQKLAELSRGHQVICVTHLPQVASFADQHFRIEKGVEAEVTRTTVSALDGESRIEELAAMLGGVRHGIEHARALVDEAIEWRAKRRSPAEAH